MERMAVERAVRFTMHTHTKHIYVETRVNIEYEMYAKIDLLHVIVVLFTVQEILVIASNNIQTSIVS